MMTDKEKEMIDGDDMVVVMTDQDGNEYYYREELIIPVGEERYAILVGIHDEDVHEHHSCGCGCEEDDEDVLVAKIVINENGEDEYIEPSEEEYIKVQEAYDALMDEEEANQE